MSESTNLSNLDLAGAYSLLGLEQEYKGCRKRKKKDSDLWSLDIIKGLTYRNETWVKAYEEAGISLEIFCLDLQSMLDLSKEQRDPNKDGNYTIFFRKTMEADEGNRNRSAQDREKNKNQDITLMERLLLGLACYLGSGDHLDLNSTTVCAGSRSFHKIRDRSRPIGTIPIVNWSVNHYGVDVSWCYSWCRSFQQGTRSVMSFSPMIGDKAGLPIGGLKNIF